MRHGTIGGMSATNEPGTHEAEVIFERPHAGRAESYRSLVAEFVERGESLIPFPLTFPCDDFGAFIARLDANSRGEGLPEGFVANTTSWLVSGGEVVAVSNMRHALTDSLRREGGHVGYGVRPSARSRGHATTILRHALGDAARLGIRDVLVTCAKTNVHSARAIQRCGGRFDSEEWIPERGEIVQRYWIRMDPHPEE